VALNSFMGQYPVDWQNLFAGSMIATIRDRIDIYP
jgi:multiple sugar transport system permease protein